MTPGKRMIDSRRIVMASTMILGLVCFAAMAQQPQEEETTRHLWDTAFITQGKKPATGKPARRNYRIVTPRVPVVGVAPETVIGITLWRLRPSLSTKRS